VRKVLLALVLVSAAAAAVVCGVRRVAPGAAARSRRTGELAVAGRRALLLPSRRWHAVGGAIGRNPGHASPHSNLRRLLFETGRSDGAESELWRAVDLTLRDLVGAVDRAVGDYEAHGLQDRAASLIADACRRFPSEARLAAHRPALLVKTGRCPEGLEARREAASRFPTDPRVHAFCGMAAARAGDRDAARPELKRSLEFDPNQPEARQAYEEISGGG